MSKIQWTDVTDNPITRAGGGHYCVKVSEGCRNCYAEKMNLSPWYSWANGKPYRKERETPDMELDEKMLASWARQRKPKHHFVCSMTDWCGEFVPDHFVYEMLDAMIAAPRQTFQLLTMRAARMSYLINHYCYTNGLQELPPNIWLGISAENWDWLGARLPLLEKTKAAVKFLSLEPLIGSIIYNGVLVAERTDFNFAIVDWVIIGGESGPNARPMDLHWAEDVIAECKAAGVPVFVKQLGTRWAKRVSARDRKGGNPAEWPPELRVRQFPEEANND